MHRHAQRSIWHPFLVFRHNCNSREWEASSVCPSREWSPLYHQWHRVSSWLARPKQWNYSLWQPGLFHADSLPVYHYTRLDWCPLLGKLLHRHIYYTDIFMAQKYLWHKQKHTLQPSSLHLSIICTLPLLCKKLKKMLQAFKTSDIKHTFYLFVCFVYMFITCNFV